MTDEKKNPNHRFATNADDEEYLSAVRVFGKNDQPCWVSPLVARGREEFNEEEAKRREQAKEAAAAAKGGSAPKPAPPPVAATKTEFKGGEAPEDSSSKEIGKKKPGS